MRNTTFCIIFIVSLFFNNLNAADDWIEKFPSLSPSERTDHAMAYISEGKVLLFGGHTGIANDEIWIYEINDNSWNQKITQLKPTARQYFSMAYIGSDKVLLFGGDVINPPHYNDETWIYDLSENSWTQKYPESKPSPRYLHAMAYIGDDKVILFGGQIENAPYSSDETWIYDLREDNWSLSNVSVAPSERHSHSLSYLGGSKVLLFGGYSNWNQDDNETWVYDLIENLWSQKNPSIKPRQRKNHALAYIGGDQILLFGGYNTGDYLGDTWIYDLSENIWIQDSNSIQPTARPSHEMSETSINGSSYIVLFGGADANGITNDTWTFGGGDYLIPEHKTLIRVPADYLTIQSAIDASFDGDTVLVAPSTYYETINFKGKAILVTSEEGPETTIIDGSQAGSVVTFNSGEDTLAILSGFTITNGKTSGNGGGIKCEASSPKILNNIITENNSDGGGGGISIRPGIGGAIIRNNIVGNNVAGGDGGGLDLYITQDILVEKNIIKENIGKAAGGILIYWGENPTVHNNLIIRNMSSGNGGGIHCISGNGTISNNTIDSNSAGQGWNGGGISLIPIGDLILKNNIITNNLVGGGVSGEPEKEFYYNNVWNNIGGNYINCDPGTNDISVDPRFVDPNNDNFNLQSNSPCIDAGDPSSPFDPDGTRADMGAYYFHQGDFEPPAKPINLQAVSSSGKILLSWSPNSESDLSYYKIYRSKIENFIPTSSDSLSVVFAPDTSYEDSNVIYGEIYYYRISAVDTSENESDYSEVVLEKIADNVPPDKPADLAAISMDNLVNLSWSQNPETDLSHYKIYRSQTNNFVPSFGDSLAVVFTPDTTYEDTDVINDQTYYYRISAVDSAGNESEFSDQASATPRAGPTDSDIYLPVTQYDFGNVLVDSSKAWLLTVKNLGSGTLEIYDIQNSVSAFSVSPKTASIADLDSFNFTLSFSPTTENTFQDTFRISSNDPDEATVLFPVTGKGLIAPQPSIFISEASHNFGNVPVLSSSSWQLTFENKGTADLLVQNIASSNPVFSADPQQFTLTPSGRQEVQVQFTPDSLLSESGVLTIHSNDPENPEKTVTLSGAGIDAESPQITVQPFTTTMQASTAFTISAHITDNWNVASAELFYRTGSESGFQRIEMGEGTSQIYSAALPASAITLQGLACFIKAEDSAGNVSATDTLSSPIRFSDGALTTGIESSPYVSGYPRGEWRMISAPADLDEKTVTAVLLDETALGSYGEPNWRLFSFEDTNGDGAKDGYAEYQASLESSDFSFAAGKAFWLKANPEGGAIHIDTGPGQVLALETKSITLSPGWNQVGNPFAFPVSFSPTNENIVDQLYAPDGNGGYELTTVLLPWAGYFVFVNGNSSVELALEPENAIPLKKMAESESGWRLRIVSECGGSSDRINYLGVCEAGSDARDKQDYPEPPVLGNYVSLYFPHADWPGRCKAYTSDIRQSVGQGQIWDVRVKSNAGAGAVRLNWAMEQPPETDLKILLYDKNRNKTIDMKTDDAYSFQRLSENEEAVFQVFAGSHGFVEKQVEALRSQFPQEFGLSQNYPNPFNATTRIDFKIPSLQRVSLKIYDLLGREVKSLLDDVRPAGYYHMVWNGRNNAGAEVSSGIYVCLVRAGEHAETRKVILMK